ISGEENRMLALKRGARTFQQKPLNNKQLDVLFRDILIFNEKDVKQLLVIEDNELESSQIVKLMQEEKIQVTIAPTGEKALELVKDNSYDTIILDYTLPDISGLDLLNKINNNKKNSLVPVIIYSARDFSKDE